MSYSSVNGIGISAIAAAVSSNWTSVDIYKKELGDDTVEKFKKNVGVLGRYDAGLRQTSSDFCYAAAKKVIDDKKIKTDDIGALIFVSQTPDYRSPATANVLQWRLGLSKKCLAFDVSLGCSGYVYGLSILASIMSTSNIKYALLLAGDTSAKEKSQIIKTKYSTASKILLGDAGTATLLEKKSAHVHSLLCADGSGYKHIIRPFTGWRNPEGVEYVQMDDIAVFNFAIEEVPKIIYTMMQREGTTQSNYDCLVLHQANQIILQQIAKKVKFPMTKVLLSLDKFGNTSSSSIPITLVKHYGEIDVCKELCVLFCGFGVGLSWGVVDTTVNTEDILPLIHTDEFFDDGYQETNQS